MPFSYDEQREKIKNALREQAYFDDDFMPWIAEHFDDHVIAEMEFDKYWSIPYTVNGEEIEIANKTEWAEVEKKEIWEEKRAQEARLNPRKARLVQEAKITPRVKENDAEFEGREWDVTIIGPATTEHLLEIDGQEYVKSDNGDLYSLEALEASVPLWDGIKVYDNHLTDEEFQQKQGMRSPTKEWLGTIVNPAWDAVSKKIIGTFKVVERALAQKLKDAHDQDILNSIGLSIDAFTTRGAVASEGKTWTVHTGFTKALSVDVVGDPAAGGGFNRLIAAQQQGAKKMNEEEIKKLVKDVVAEVVPTAVTAALEAQPPPKEEEPPVETPEIEELPEDEEPKVEDSPELEGDEPPLPAGVQEAMNKIDLFNAQQLLDKRLKEAKLPASFEGVIRDTFEGRVFEAKELEAMIKRLKKAQAEDDKTGRVTEGGQQRGEDMQIFSEEDKHAMMFLRKILMGSGRHNLATIEQNQENRYVKPRVFEAYRGWVNAGKPNLNYNGRLSELLRVGFMGGEWSLDNLRVKEASTLTTVIKNTVNIVTALDYMGTNKWYEPIVDVLESDNPIDTFTLARLFGATSLDVVAKGAPYTEMVLQDEEETASHVKQGNYISIYLEDLLADKINYFTSLPSRIADAWTLTLSAKVAGVFTTNSAAGPVLSDTGALFNSTAVTTAGGHANLLTAALSFTAYDAVITAMTNQTRRVLGTGQKITNMGPFHLLHPNALRSTVNFIRNTENVPGTGDFQRNPYGPDNDGGQRPVPVNVPDWTDTDNWAVLARYNGMSPIKLIFPPGMLTPEIFVADAELAGTMFTNDTIRYKIRMMTYRFSSTYDVAPVVDWRLLHKNNV